MNSLSTFGRWTIRFDRSDTARRYALLSSGKATRCSCTECLNFAAVGARAFPEDFRQMAEQLGIDLSKPAELCHYVKEPSGLRLTGGWFHVVGTLQSGADAFKESEHPNVRIPDFEKLPSGAEFGFSSIAHLVDPAFKGVPLIQIEFLTRVPWVLSPELDA